MASLSTNELRLFHAVDRRVFSRLVFSLGTEPFLAMRIMALWVWMETMGFPSFVHQLAAVSDSVLLYLVQESMKCLRFLDMGAYPAPQTAGISVASRILNRSSPLSFFLENRQHALRSIAKTVQNVFSRAFDDIIDRALMTRRLERVVQSIDFAAGEGTSRQPLRAPVQLTAGSLNTGAAGPLNTNVNHEPPEGRTLFITFSRGYPLSMEEVVEFFVRNYGNVVDYIQMQDVGVNEQPLYAVVVLYHPSLIPPILNGANTAKYSINGKHIWMRRYETRNRNRQA